MSVFRPRSNTIFRVVLVILVGGAVGTLGGLMGYARVPYGTGEQDEVAQPVLFDHRHHILDDGIDCRYCHQGAERTASAGIPSPFLA